MRCAMTNVDEDAKSNPGVLAAAFHDAVNAIRSLWKHACAAKAGGNTAPGDLYIRVGIFHFGDSGNT